MGEGVGAMLGEEAAQQRMDIKTESYSSRFIENEGMASGGR